MYFAGNRIVLRIRGPVPRHWTKLMHSNTSSSRSMPKNLPIFETPLPRSAIEHLSRHRPFCPAAAASRKFLFRVGMSNGMLLHPENVPVPYAGPKSPVLLQNGQGLRTSRLIPKRPAKRSARKGILVPETYTGSPHRFFVSAKNLQCCCTTYTLPIVSPFV